MQYMRFRPQGVQVPELTYVKNGKRIVIQGAVHIGSKKFYEKVLDRMKGFDGEVHLEGVRPKVDEEGNIIKNPELLDNVYGLTASVANLSFQKQYIHRDLTNMRKFFNHDLSMDDMKDAKIDEKILEELQENFAEYKKRVLTSPALLLGASPLFNILMMAVGASDVKLDNEHIILHQRNNYAMDKAFETYSDVYLFWGAKHIEGMNRILVDHGYKMIDKRWETVIPNLRIRDAFSDDKKRTVENYINKIEELLV